VSTADGDGLAALAREREVPLTALGRVGGQRLLLGTALDAAVDDLRRLYEEALPLALGEDVADDV
ncbi:MAG: hypothetical protein IIC88_01250, partial [Chloroflexi bacterium]|nr:hypothetical protein [Chloroflexota bacterium]